MKTTTEKRMNARDRQRKHREKLKKNADVTDVTKCHAMSHHIDIDIDIDKKEKINKKEKSLFETAWKLYPPRSGGNSKAAARRQWDARIKQGECQSEMLSGVERYKRYCDSTGKSGTEFVKQGSTFFGRDKHYLESWEIPKTQGKPSMRDQLKAAYGGQKALE
jgi:hypothetical protein